MKKAFVVYIILFILGCSIIPKSPEGSRIIMKREFPAISTPDSVEWSIVPYKELENYCWKNKFGYTGSFEKYHLLEWWSKVIPVSGAEFKFAVIKSEYSPNKTFEYQGRYTLNDSLP